MPTPAEYNCVITRQGEKKGPFTLTMLRRMRTDELLNESDFTPEEWTALMQVLDSAEIRETSFWTRKPLVKIKRLEENQGVRMAGLRTVLTWTGFCIGASFVAWGVFRSEERIPWRSPVLLVAAFFAVVLTRTCVGRLVRRKLFSGASKLTVKDAYGQFAMGIIPLILVTAATVGSAFFFVSREAWVQVAINGAICLGLGVLLSARIPSAYFEQWRFLSLPQIPPHSGPWSVLPVLVLVLLVVQNYAGQIPQAHEVLVAAQKLLLRVEPEQALPEWQFNVRIGGLRSQVEGVLGPPDRSEDGEQWYDRPGVGIRYDTQGKVTHLRFPGPVPGETPAPIAWGLTDASSLKQLASSLGPATTVNGYKTYQVYTWDKPPLRIVAEVWIGTSAEPGATNGAGSLRQLEITGLEPSLGGRF